MNRRDLRKRVPHGYVKEIVKRSGKTNASVSNWFKDEHRFSPDIEHAVISVIKELEKNKHDLYHLL